ncbi:hypothetical protein HanLR1_Chr14g0548651 [Helianthus annuus]|nr:hypothetical protein HanLR1_Chr14g0548651 [Helianthus annuus]
MAVATTIAIATAANRKLSILRPHFCTPRYATSNPITHFRHHHLIHNVCVDDVHVKPHLLLLPPRAFTVDLIQDAGASLLVGSAAYALVSGFDNLTRRQIIEQVSFC